MNVERSTADVKKISRVQQLSSKVLSNYVSHSQVRETVSLDSFKSLRHFANCTPPPSKNNFTPRRVVTFG